MRRVTGGGDDRRLFYSTNNNNNDNKIPFYIIFYLISLPNDIVTKTIDHQLPIGRAASPFYLNFRRLLLVGCCVCPRLLAAV